MNDGREVESALELQDAIYQRLAR